MDARDAAARDGGERGDAEPFLAVRGSVARVRLWAGFAAFVAWINLLFCFEGLLRDQVAYGGGVIHDPLFLAATLAAALLLLASPRIGRSAVRRRAARRGVAESGDSGEAEGRRAFRLGGSPLVGRGRSCRRGRRGPERGRRPGRRAVPRGRDGGGPGRGRLHRPLHAVVGRRRVGVRHARGVGLALFCVLRAVAALHCRGVRRRCGQDSACGGASPVLGMVPARVRGGRRPAAQNAGFPAWTRGCGKAVGDGAHCRSAVLLFVRHPVRVDLQCGHDFRTFGRGPVLGGVRARLRGVVRHHGTRAGADEPVAHVPHGAVLSQRVLFGIAGSCALGVAHEQLFFSYTVVYVAYALIVPTMWVLS